MKQSHKKHSSFNFTQICMQQLIKTHVNDLAKSTKIKYSEAKKNKNLPPSNNSQKQKNRKKIFSKGFACQSTKNCLSLQSQQFSEIFADL